MFKVFWLKYGKGFLSCIFYIYQKIMADYLESVLCQIQNDPYVNDLTNIKEPNYMIVHMNNGKWGFHRFS